MALVERSEGLAGYETRVLEVDGEGPLLLLLHGFSDSADTWRPSLARLARAGRRAMALDLPCFGRASACEAGAVLPQLDLFTLAAIERFGGENGVILCGNSLGGCTALRVAAVEDLPILGVVPVAPAGLDMARWISIIERDRAVRSLLALPVPLPPTLVRATVAQVYRRLAFKSSRGLAPDAVSTFTSHFAGRETIRGHLALARRLLPELRSPFELERIRAPVLMVWGDSDLLVFSTGAERVLREVEGSRLVVIPNCGHCPQLECPDRLVGLLEEFASEVAGVDALG